MSVSKKRNTARRIVDAAMTVVLLFLMAYQVTGEMLHFEAPLPQDMERLLDLL